MRRRIVLSSISVALSSSLSGCSAIGSPTSENRDTVESDAGSNTSSEDTDTDESDVESSPHLGAAQRVSIAAEPEQKSEPDSDESFDEWITRSAAFAAASHIKSLLEEKEMIEEGIHVGPHNVKVANLADNVDESEFERAIPIGVVVRQTPGFIHMGESISEPEIEFDKLVAATPRSIEVTMMVDDDEHSVVLPVVCRNESTW